MGVKSMWSTNAIALAILIGANLAISFAGEALWLLMGIGALLCVGYRRRRPFRTSCGKSARSARAKGLRRGTALADNFIQRPAKGGDGDAVDGLYAVDVVAAAGDRFKGVRIQQGAHGMDALSRQGMHHAGGYAGGANGLLPVEVWIGLRHRGNFRH